MGPVGETVARHPCSICVVDLMIQIKVINHHVAPFTNLHSYANSHWSRRMKPLHHPCHQWAMLANRSGAILGAPLPGDGPIHHPWNSIRAFGLASWWVRSLQMCTFVLWQTMHHIEYYQSAAVKLEVPMRREEVSGFTCQVLNLVLELDYGIVVKRHVIADFSLYHDW